MEIETQHKEDHPSDEQPGEWKEEQGYLSSHVDRPQDEQVCIDDEDVKQSENIIPMEIVDPIHQDFYDAIDENRNIFLTGVAGSGKSYLISQMMRRDSLSLKSKKIYITSTTGVSAVSIGGRTIHSFSGIGICKTKDHAYNTTKSKPSAVAMIKSCDILVIDEISMAGCNLLENLDHVFKKVRKSKKVFGGIQVIFTGDFLQLPPVDDQFAFQSPVWKELNLTIIHLKKVYRFTDPIYSELLMRVRTATHTREDNKILMKRKKAYDKLDSSEGGTLEIKPTFLYGKRVNTEQKNMEELEKNPNTLHTVVSQDEVGDDPKAPPVPQDLLNNLAPEKLHLKIGAQVMLTKNMDVSGGLCNGSRGVVTKISGDRTTISVKFLNGKEIEFDKNPYKYMITDNNGKEKTRATRHQFPFILAYALTIHKAQGSSLDCAIVDAGNNIFEAHMTYVALSRIRSRDGLYLKNYEPSKITVHPDVMAYLTEAGLL